MNHLYGLHVEMATQGSSECSCQLNLVMSKTSLVCKIIGNLNYFLGNKVDKGN